MENVKPIQLDTALRARLHAAVRPRGDAIGMTAADSGDYLVRDKENPLGQSTLGNSLKKRLQRA